MAVCNLDKGRKQNPRITLTNSSVGHLGILEFHKLRNRCSPPDEIFKMAARFATVTEEEIRQMNEEATPANTKSTCLVNTKITIPLSVGA